MPSRRAVLRAGLLASGALLLPRWARPEGALDFPSPTLRPFATELPIPPMPQAASPFAGGEQASEDDG